MSIGDTSQAPMLIVTSLMGLSRNITGMRRRFGNRSAGSTVGVSVGVGVSVTVDAGVAATSKLLLRVCVLLERFKKSASFSFDSARVCGDSVGAGCAVGVGVSVVVRVG